MQRHLLGFITLALLLVAAGATFLPSTESSTVVFGAACFRLAILFGVMWLALPNMLSIAEKLPAWLIGTTLLAMGIMAVRPRTILFVGPLLLAIWVLAPNWFARKK